MKHTAPKRQRCAIYTRKSTEHTELGFGEAPPEGEEDWDLVNTGKETITLKPGA